MEKTVTLWITEGGDSRRLLPLTWLRPAYDLRCGILTLREKILRAYDQPEYALECRPYLAEYLAEQNPDAKVNQLPGGTVLAVNGRVLWNAELARLIPLEGPDRYYRCGDELVAARLSGANLAAMDPAEQLSSKQLPTVESEEVEATIIKWTWDLVHHNAGQIIADFPLVATAGAIEGRVMDGAYLVEKGNICLAPGSEVRPGAVLDASGGPIFIDRDATIMSGALIEGPVYVGHKSAIKMGAKIYEGTTIGEVCKVGGEVAESIVHSYSNKHHDGFLGHAYLGQWVNLGAGTCNSDLKNDYGQVKVMVDGDLVDTGSIFVGAAIGDHTKTGINTILNTGTVLGIGCNIYGADFPPKYVPSFSWGGAGGLQEYRLEKCLQVARRVMGRRQLDLTAAGEQVIRRVFQETAAEREGF